MIRITLRAIGITAILSALILSLNLIVGAHQAERPAPPPDKGKLSEQENGSKDQKYDLSTIIALARNDSPPALCRL